MSKSRGNRVFIEITSREHDHGGPGWEFGKFLWCPSRNRAGADRYAVMREVAPGDKIFHFIYNFWADGVDDTRFCGYSRAASSVVELQDEPPLPGEWSGMSSYYRVSLKDYVDLAHPIPLSRIVQHNENELLEDIKINRPKWHPFVLYKNRVRSSQGLYLARCGDILNGILSQFIEGDIDKSHLIFDVEFTESKRMSAERYFFSRNRQLTEEAKRQRGCVCEVCGFKFEKFYGSLGLNFIEVHHIQPLSERSESCWTTELKTKISDVAVLCSNCHRMIHRSVPAISLNDLRESIKKIGGNNI